MKFISLPAGKRSKWVVIAVWLLIAVLTLPFTGKLNDVSTDSQNAFLPKSAESSKLVDAQKQLASASTFDITAIYRKQAGAITSAEREQVIATRQRLLDKYPTAVNPQPAAFSSSSAAAQIVLSIPERDITLPGKTFADSEVIAIKDIRAIVANGYTGFDVKVTGPGAFEADTKEISASINAPLLLGTLLVVTLVLLVTYRSPVLWLLPIVVVAFGDGLASWFIYKLTVNDVITLDGQSANIVPVLAFGVGTDYALLLLSRYREELRKHADRHDAMAHALRKAGPTILASSLIVVCAMLSLLLSDLRSNQALAVVGALSIGLVAVASATLLPALLVACGRRAFWPLVPKAGEPATDSTIWSRVGERVASRPVAIAASTTALLIVFGAAGMTQIDTNLKLLDSFREEPDSVQGQRILKQTFIRGTSEPLLLVANTRQVDQVRNVLAESKAVNIAIKTDESNPGPNAECVPNIDSPGKCTDLNGKTQFAVKMENDPDSDVGHNDIRQLRTELHTIAGADALLGSGAATRMDLADTARHDRLLVIPVMLIAAFIVFALLLRAIVAPAILIATTLVSYLAALGVGVLASRYLFGFPAEDSSLILISFVFLVSLGIDYNVFLAARTREAAEDVDMETATLTALTKTGTVITSAGAVLAATFAVLATQPIVYVTQLGFTVAFGVLLDTFVVRTILVPALFVWLGDKTWWPSRLAEVEGSASR